MVNERTYQMSAEQTRQEARRQERMVRIHMGVLAVGGAALASGLIPMNDMTILLGLSLGCSALLRVLYRM
ncbi:MAG: hypothetical protein ACI4MK_10250 [Aristaeellaceae bacterium]